ncbi:PTS glucose transporter subunit IIA [uncultured Faecalibaculum sp.]|uniref:PTS sugar transporter subunit IIA n=1 Tax=uncultured Faecalibaculum sp. TaxID=1729681 RepID=UPI0026754F7D|nr:PTS glucose transporter subunit IIA [uncultured Faecalibaculum sp.]
MTDKRQNDSILIVLPLDGEIVPIDQVPDPIFSGRMMGDGAAVIPENGKIVAPVDGTLSMIAPTRHAFGFKTADGKEVLVHVGLETVGLEGAPFTVHAKAGDKVKKGDLIAEVDLDFLKEKGINPITPIILCKGGDDGSWTSQKERAKPVRQPC